MRFPSSTRRGNLLVGFVLCCRYLYKNFTPNSWLMFIKFSTYPLFVTGGKQKYTATIHDL
jgi:hypothetical protein